MARHGKRYRATAEKAPADVLEPGEAIAFLKRMNEVVHHEHPGVLTFAEESTAFTGVSRPVTRFTARSLNVTGERPGGQERHFWVPL